MRDNLATRFSLPLVFSLAAYASLIRCLVINSRITRPWRWNFRGPKLTEGPRVYNYQREEHGGEAERHVGD